MQEESTLASDSSTPTLPIAPKPQFNTRAIFYLTLSVAVVAAVIGPYVREWTTEQQLLYLLTVLLEVLLIAGTTVSVLYQRRKLRTQAGPCYFRTSYLDRKADSFTSVCKAEWWALFPILTQLIYNLGWCAWVIHSKQSNWALLVGYTHIPGLFVGVSRYNAIIWGNDYRDFELCEHGFITGGFAYFPWDVVKAVRPTSSSEDRITIVVQTGSLQITQVLPATARTREEIVRRLNQHLASLHAAEAV